MGSVPLTTHYSLAKPPSGETGWTDQMNGNLDTIDATMYGLSQGGTTGAQGPPGATGPVGMVWTGPWSSAVAYVATDAVGYNGSSWIARQSNQGVPPSVGGNTWDLLASIGQTGATGATGAQGPAGSGGGTTVTFPIAVIQGGTGAEDAPTARTNLGAAASGQNTDITALLNLVTSTSRAGGAIQITSPGGSGNAILFGNGTQSGAISSDGIGYFESLEVAGQVICGGLTSSSLLEVNEIGNATPGEGVDIVAQLLASSGVVIQGATPSASSGQIGIGATIVAGATIPGTSISCLQINAAGTILRIPLI